MTVSHDERALARQLAQVRKVRRKEAKQARPKNLKADRGGERGFWSALGIDPIALAERIHAVSGDIEAGETIIKQARRMGPETPNDH